MDEMMNEVQEIVEDSTTLDDEKVARFREESKAQMQKICGQIDRLTKIASKRSVDYFEDDVVKMFDYLYGRLDKSKETFMARFEENDAFSFDF